MKPKRLRQMAQTEGAIEIGTGALRFDCTMARQHGWNESQIERAWGELTKVYQKWATVVERMHPDLYGAGPDGTRMFVGPDESGHRLSRSR